MSVQSLGATSAAITEAQAQVKTEEIRGKKGPRGPEGLQFLSTEQYILKIMRDHNLTDFLLTSLGNMRLKEVETKFSSQEVVKIKRLMCEKDLLPSEILAERASFQKWERDWEPKFKELEKKTSEESKQR
jgi:hypothetical protein